MKTLSDYINHSYPYYHVAKDKYKTVQEMWFSGESWLVIGLAQQFGVLTEYNVMRLCKFLYPDIVSPVTLLDIKKANKQHEEACQKRIAIYKFCKTVERGLRPLSRANDLFKKEKDALTYSNVLYLLYLIQEGRYKNSRQLKKILSHSIADWLVKNVIPKFECD